VVATGSMTLDRGVLFALMTGYASLDEDSNGRSLKLVLAL